MLRGLTAGEQAGDNKCPRIKLSKVRRMGRRVGEQCSTLHVTVWAGLCEEGTCKQRPDEGGGCELCRYLQVNSQPGRGQRVLRRTGSYSLGESSGEIL